MRGENVMRKRSIIVLGVALMCIGFAGCGNTQNATERITQQATEKVLTKEVTVNLKSVENDHKQMKEVFSQKFQEDVLKQVDTLKKSDSYSMDKPLAIYNPYGTVDNGLYLYFQTEDLSYIEYTVETEGYGSFTRTLKNDGENNLNTEHEYMLIGAIPGEVNEITLNKYDKDNKLIDTVKFDYNAPEIPNDFGYQCQMEKGESDQALSDGLYVSFRNVYTKAEKGDQAGVEKETDYYGMSMFDNEGVIRCIMPIESFMTHRLVFDEEGGLYYAASKYKLVRMERTGYVSNVYNTGKYGLHHDVIMGENNKIILCGTGKSGESEEDLIITIDRVTGEVEKMVDFREMFSEYYNNTTWGKYTSKRLDWFHINGMTLTDEGDLIISAREISILLKITDIYNEPKIEYILGSDNFFKDTEYEKYLYKPVGEKFSLHTGQHSVDYITDERLEKGQYYLTLYNNNMANSTYGATTYDWSADENYFGATFLGKVVDNDEVDSYYYKYLVDENKKTFELVDSIPVDYSAIVSSAQLLDNGNVVTCSGMKKSIAEYDSEGKLIAKFIGIGKGYIYRSYKYDLKGEWFE